MPIVNLVSAIKNLCPSNFEKAHPRFMALVGFEVWATPLIMQKKAWKLKTLSETHKSQ